jgi:sulfate permease, SulP family
MTQIGLSSMPDGSATAHLYLYRPKLGTVLADGYGFGSFRKDAMAALTVAIVALPLSMAIAVASGVSPERGLYTAVIGGFLVSALGGSRFKSADPLELSSFWWQLQLASLVLKAFCSRFCSRD